MPRSRRARLNSRVPNVGSGSAGDDANPLPVTRTARDLSFPAMRFTASGSVVNKYQQRTAAAAAAATANQRRGGGFMGGGCAQGLGPQTDSHSALAAFTGTGWSASLYLRPSAGSSARMCSSLKVTWRAPLAFLAARRRSVVSRWPKNFQSPAALRAAMVRE